ncbi:riboflavin synthase [Turicibacter sp. TJ11]|uniref:riboflavin synthase n=1 Tax=Turicibacter sp. TJ11 TaxID=2806443 RepID=UPI001F261DAB|nr:riboflavin synthase [Turicibacter sp. TJ11]
MFTGIIEEVGTIKGIKKGEKSSKLTIVAHKVLQETMLGDSIATNGVCLTVTKLGQDWFEADVMAETLRRSNLNDLVLGSSVNLERAIQLKSRLGGHLVSGHIDGLGQIVSKRKEDNATWITVKAPYHLLKYVVEKGSIAIDGISLTVATVEETCFSVSIIPHTGQETTLLNKKLGDSVNLEVDMIGKYVEKFLNFQSKTISNTSTISEEFLKNHGFL